MLQIATMARRTEEYQYPAYALKSDDGERPKKNQYPAYALKSDDGEKPTEKPISCLCCKKRRWRIEEQLKPGSNY
jgi:hypothetical protein